ncbi:uncharacterized protein LOC122813006 isoform X2 [Protopterus annectens]|uniref:uncharacterized protein LOC122813006 isoform X2 n=1 Tax=Protopterus annectens TaxID=7888 RepID=UPI001CFB2EFC|nr:uncharacterized protein LOC122813006 isoform X2 [Protopterus annectens]
MIQDISVSISPYKSYRFKFFYYYFRWLDYNTMLKTLTRKLKNQSLSEIPSFQLKISYHPNEEDESEDSEGENQELAQIDRERRRKCSLTPLATNQLQNQGNRLCKVRPFFHNGLDHHSSEEELERICLEKRKWSQMSQISCCGDSTSSSDEEVRDLCRTSFMPVDQADHIRASPSPVLFSASPPKRLQPLLRSAARPVIIASVGASFDQASPCKRHRKTYGDKVSRPSLDLEKMQQKMLLKKNCGAKSRVIKIRTSVMNFDLDFLQDSSSQDESSILNKWKILLF